MRRATLVLLLALAGCTGRDSVRDAGDSARSLVRVDLSYTQVAGAPEIRYDAQAHFVRYRSFEADAVPTILGFVDYDGIPVDSCRISDGTAELDAALSVDPAIPAEVTLLDAGRVEVRGPIDRALLRPTHYPELVPFVSGVVYGGDDTHPVALGPGEPYFVSGDGGEEVGPFAAQVMAPRAFPQLQLEPVQRGEALDVRWGGDPGAEPLYLEVKWSARAGTRPGTWMVRCRVRDDGEFTVPREALEGISPAATVTASRVARAAFVAPALGRGVLAVELRHVAPLQVAP